LAETAITPPCVKKKVMSRLDLGKSILFLPHHGLVIVGGITASTVPDNVTRRDVTIVVHDRRNGEHRCRKLENNNNEEALKSPQSPG
jgi:hypothetical protein